VPEPPGGAGTTCPHPPGRGAIEDALLEAILRPQVGIDPFRVGQVLDLAAVGIVNPA